MKCIRTFSLWTYNHSIFPTSNRKSPLNPVLIGKNLLFDLVFTTPCEKHDRVESREDMIDLTQVNQTSLQLLFLHLIRIGGCPGTMDTSPGPKKAKFRTNHLTYSCYYCYQITILPSRKNSQRVIQHKYVRFSRICTDSFGTPPPLAVFVSFADFS